MIHSTTLSTMDNLGYNQNLFILAFDHQNSFEKAGFKDIPEIKNIIYEAFKNSLPSVQNAAILIDEKYGSAVLTDAKENSITIALRVEKSASEDFIFEYGDDFQSHIEKYNPEFAKVVIDISRGISDLTKGNLKKLSDFCLAKNYKFLLEILADGQLETILKSISEIQSLGVAVDVWKVEGMQNESSYEKIVNQARAGGRENVSIVILGRGENRSLVEKWIKTGSKVPGVIGFAVGRTIFWDPISQLSDGKIKREEAILEISENYKYFYNLFLDKKTK